MTVLSCATTAATPGTPLDYFKGGQRASVTHTLPWEALHDHKPQGPRTTRSSVISALWLCFPSPHRQAQVPHLPSDGCDWAASYDACVRGPSSTRQQGSNCVTILLDTWRWTLVWFAGLCAWFVLNCGVCFFVTLAVPEDQDHIFQ